MDIYWVLRTKLYFLFSLICAVNCSTCNESFKGHNCTGNTVLNRKPPTSSWFCFDATELKHNRFYDGCDSNSGAKVISLRMSCQCEGHTRAKGRPIQKAFIILCGLPFLLIRVNIYMYGQKFCPLMYSKHISNPYSFNLGQTQSKLLLL